MVQHAIK